MPMPYFIDTEMIAEEKSHGGYEFYISISSFFDAELTQGGVVSVTTLDDVC